MTTYALCPQPNYVSLNASKTGPNALGKLYTYVSGTTTPQTTWTDSTGNSTNTNPVIFDANGEAEVWLDASLTYTLLETDANDVPLRTKDVIKNAAGATGAAGTFACSAAGGTVDAITGDYDPNLTLADKTMCAFVSAGKNTVTNPTFAPDGLTPHTIVKNGGAALVVGDTGNAGRVNILEYNLANTRWELLNPVYPNTFRGALVYKSANQTITTGTPTLVTFNTESYDTDTIHSTSADTSRLVVPAGVTKVKLTASVSWVGDSAGTQRLVAVLKNGSDMTPKCEWNIGLSEANSTDYSFSTGVVTCAASDYFEMRVSHDKGGDLDIQSGATWFCMECIG